MQYYEVAPTKIIRAGSATFTYAYEENLDDGTVVEIEVGKKNLTGVIINKVEKPSYKTKQISRTLENNPLPKPLLKTALWISDYYATPLATVLQTVMPRGIGKKRRSSADTTLRYTKKPEKITFTNDQKNAIKNLDSREKGTTLLHGVTGSGKTAVYIDQAQKAIRNGKSVILLVPEISLTAQLVNAFSAHLDNVYLTHSRQTEAERHQAWRNISEQTKPTVVIGPRSALFMPTKNIGLIIIDEMHEPSFKQEQSPRYSALRVASILASRSNAKLILGSATPPVSEYYLADKAGQSIVAMTTPAKKGTKPPKTTVVDMTKRTNFQRHRFFSNKLIIQIEETLAAKKQVLIFHNRRGSASITLCENCSWSAGCSRCFLPLTLHTDQHILRCHVCNNTERIPTSCPECGKAGIIHKGIGTKIIESELRKLFPKHSIARFDGDASGEQTVDKQFKQLRDGGIDIIIGTQVIAKGLDLPHLRTVGVIQADAGLSLPDYSASERTFQLLAQVVGRVGRSAHDTNVIVQSYQPSHPSIQLGITQNYAEFYSHALAERKRAHFPPYTFLLKLTCVYKTEDAAVRNARQLASKLRKHVAPTVEILGPTPAFYERQHDTYRWQLVLKSSKRADLVALLDHLPSAHWQYELDPSSLL